MTRATKKTPVAERKPQEPNPGGKTCKTCCEDKPLTEFYAKPTARDGLFGQCKACVLKARRVAYSARPEMRDRIKRQAAAWKREHAARLAAE